MRQNTRVLQSQCESSPQWQAPRTPLLSRCSRLSQSGRHHCTSPHHQTYDFKDGFAEASDPHETQQVQRPEDKRKNDEAMSQTSEGKEVLRPPPPRAHLLTTSPRLTPSVKMLQQFSKCGTALVVSKLGSCTSTSGSPGSILVGEPRLHMLCGMTKNKS